MAGITKWFWITIVGYLSYLLPQFEDLAPTSLGSGAIQTRRKCVAVTTDYCNLKLTWSFESVNVLVDGDRPVPLIPQNFDLKIGSIMQH